MNKIKSMILIGALALIAAIPLQAQSIVTLIGGGTNGVNGPGTNGGYVITVPRSGNVAVQLSFRAIDSGSTSNLMLRFDRGLLSGNPGNTQWENNFATFAIAATSTTTNSGVTNLNIGGIGFLRVNIANTNAALGMTNLHLYYSYKPGI